MNSIMLKMASLRDFELEYGSAGISTSMLMFDTVTLMLLLLLFVFDCEQINILSSRGIEIQWKSTSQPECLRSYVRM